MTASDAYQRWRAAPFPPGGTTNLVDGAHADLAYWDAIVAETVVPVAEQGQRYPAELDLSPALAEFKERLATSASLATPQEAAALWSYVEYLNLLIAANAEVAVGEAVDVTSTFEAWFASLDWGDSPDAKVFLQQVFDEHGPVSDEALRRIAYTHQQALARVAVERLGQDVAATTDLGPPSFDCRNEDGSVRLSLWGIYATSPLFGLTQAEVTVEVAEFMQDEVMEYLRGVWPECREHRLGLHPAVSGDKAVWECRAGAHEVADIGQLRR